MATIAYAEYLSEGFRHSKCEINIPISYPEDRFHEGCSSPHLPTSDTVNRRLITGRAAEGCVFQRLEGKLNGKHRCKVIVIWQGRSWRCPQWS